MAKDVASVLRCSSSLVMASGQNTPRIFRRHLFWKVSSLCASLAVSFPALGAVEKYTENITIVQSQFCFQSQLLGFPDGLQHSEGLTCLSDPSHGIFCRVSICGDFASQVCKVLNVFQSITVVYVGDGVGVICLVDPHQFGFCCVEL